MSELITQKNNAIDHSLLLSDLRNLISITKNRVLRSVNAEMTLLYWQVGNRIQADILSFERAEYGQKILKNLSRTLHSEYGAGFSERNLAYMIKFSESFPDLHILQTLSAKLTWSHFIELLRVKEKQALQFYTYMCVDSQWSVRQLHDNIHRMLFERTEISKKSPKEIQKNLETLIKDSQLSKHLVLKDPYILDFLNLPQEHYESDLEAAILQEIEKFLLELGTGFSFVARQKRITIEDEHFYIDLLFYNRRIKRLVALELKTGRFKAEYKGQMELYLNWLKKYECFNEEEAPIGIILCTEKSAHQIELLDLSNSGIHVAEYWTELPPKEILERKIQQIVCETKAKIEALPKE